MHDELVTILILCLCQNVVKILLKVLILCFWAKPIMFKL